MAATPLSDPPLLRLSSPVDLLTAIPYLLGFHPERSLVALGLHGPRQRVCFELRADLDAVPDDVLIADVSVRLAHAGAEVAVVAIYDPPADHAPLPPPRRALFDALDVALAEQRISVREALCVAHGRWWSYLCADPGCCPADGTPLPTDDDTKSSPVAAAATYAGLAALPSRAALAASLAPPKFLARAAMEQALDQMHDELLASRESRAATRLWRRRAIAGFRDALHRYRRPPTQVVDDDEAARLIVSLHDVPVRDAVLEWSAGGAAEPLRNLLGDLVRRAVPPYDAAPAAVLAWVAYATGGGALVSVALDRALASDPNYSLGRLLAEALERGIPSSAVRGVALATAKARRRGRRRW